METGVYVPYKNDWQCVGWVKEPVETVEQHLIADGAEIGKREIGSNYAKVFVTSYRKRRKTS